jgi:selT/selW/selH-like putative selenoprotein
MLSTGAFELYLNGDLVYSKLATGRMPQVSDVVEALATKGLKASISY